MGTPVEGHRLRKSRLATRSGRRGLMPAIYQLGSDLARPAQVRAFSCIPDPIRTSDFAFLNRGR
jgi:hypothetical protein